MAEPPKIRKREKIFPVEHTVNLRYDYGDEQMGLTVEKFLLHAVNFIENHYTEIEDYYKENDMPFDPEQVAQETWDMLRDGSYERP